MYPRWVNFLLAIWEFFDSKNYNVNLSYVNFLGCEYAKISSNIISEIFR